MARGCIICRCKTQELDASGRCPSCAAVLAASKLGVSYGHFMAIKNHEAISQAVTAETEQNEAPQEREVKKRECPYCGKLFVPVNASHRFCGGYCRKMFSLRSRRERYRDAHALIRQDRFCAICGKKLPADMHIKATACAGECSLTYRQRKYEEKLAKQREQRRLKTGGKK